MAVIQISKIQMRRGAEADLPGAPTSLAPLAFAPGLDIGELGFATDTGRVFIGHDPNTGNANYRRTTFPYQNIEILTENSTLTLRKIVDGFNREIGAGGFISATLNANAAFDDIPVMKNGVPLAYRFDGDTLLASIEYFIYDSENRPVRQGTLRVLSEDNVPEAIMADNSISTRRLDLTGEDALTGEAVFENVEFMIVRDGPPSDPHFKFKYRNYLTEPLKFFFKIQRPIP